MQETKNIQTADLCDDFIQELDIVAPIFKDYGKRKFFHGEIVTVKLFEDNVLFKKMLQTDGTGKVIVLDGGGSLRCALMGDRLATLAVENNWAGVVIFGCIRDSMIIADIEVGVKAVNTCPAKSIKRGEGQTNIPVTFGGVTFKPGQYLYADEDGIVVANRPLV